MLKNRPDFRPALRPGGRPQAGFTIIEVMITVTILAIVMVIGAPAMRDFMVRNRITGQSSDLASDLQLARSEANRRGQRVVVCQTDSTYAACGTGGWTAGWILFIDANSNAALDTGEEVIRVHQALPTDLTVAVSPSATKVTYRPTGMSDAARTFTICQTKYIGRVLSISVTGRTTVAPTAAVCP